MKRSIFAVCDPESEYAENFADYLNQKNQLPFEVHAFTSPEALVAFAREHPIELLLVNASALTREVKLLETGKLVILSEGEECPDPYDSVYKYQSTSRIVQETMAVYGEGSTRYSLLPVLHKNITVFGVYSPLGRCGKTTFALTLGQELARTRPTLYLSLDGWSGFSALMKRDFSRSFSDLLYYARLREEGMIHRINSAVVTKEHLDYIPPVTLEDDIRQATWEDLEYILNEIVSYSNYESIIIDIGNAFPDPFRLIQWCGTVFLPVLEDPVSVCKLNQFEHFLTDPAYNGIGEKITKVNVPLLSCAHSSDNYVEKLLWSETGEYVREILKHQP